MLTMPLSLQNPVADYICGAVTLRYILHPKRGDVQLTLFPTARHEDLLPRREHVPLHPTQAKKGGTFSSFASESFPDSLVQVALRGDTLASGFIAGHSLRNSSTTLSLRLRDQIVHEEADSLRILTRLVTPEGLCALHDLQWERHSPGFILRCSLINESSETVVLEHLSSFSIGKLSPFASDDAPGRLRLHRFQSAWSLEGRHENRSIENLHLERTWAGYGHVNLRYGQVGSQPVRGYFPFVALEDSEASILWGATLAWHGSWQMEVCRREDPIVLAGGQADFDFGHWSKTLAPGESHAAPPALISCVDGDIEDLCHALVRTQDLLAHPEPAGECALPIVFNEWCSSWGNPTHDGVIATAKCLVGTPVSIFVIDDGWAKRPGNDFQTNGDWIVDPVKFPHGIRATADALSAMGITPGIWFEFEVVNRGNPLFDLHEHQLQRHGKVIGVGGRHFWDLRDPWTRDFLREKVLHFLRDNHFTYLKVDYNDSIGVGCDTLGDPTADLGEGLRQHLAAVKDFFHELRRELPDLRIENCSSGGHRLEAGMIGLSTMSSFSDAHECVEIPILAANLLRLIPARKSQIWIVLRGDDTPQRLEYGFAATFLGRMAISGDLLALTAEQKGVMDRALAFYTRIHRILRDGSPRLFRDSFGESYRYPEGWQAVRLHAPSQEEVLVVVHSFANTPSSPMRIPLPPGSWHICEQFASARALVKGDQLSVELPGDFHATALLLKRV